MRQPLYRPPARNGEQFGIQAPPGAVLIAHKTKQYQMSTTLVRNLTPARVSTPRKNQTQSAELIGRCRVV